MIKLIKINVERTEESVYCAIDCLAILIRTILITLKIANAKSYDCTRIYFFIFLFGWKITESK